MAKLKSNTKSYEVRFALALLKALHANVNNYYLLLSIIAWTRDVAGLKWKGNNPLGIGNGKRFSTVEAAARATARKLLLGKQYATLIKRIHGEPKADAAKQSQAIDFLMLLAYSTWDAGHYGVITQGDYNWQYHSYGPPVVDYGPEGFQKNRLITILETKLWGHPIIIPGTPAKPAKKAAKPRAEKPIGKLWRHPTVVFIDPYAALGFYNARHVVVPPVPTRPAGILSS